MKIELSADDIALLLIVLYECNKQDVNVNHLQGLVNRLLLLRLGVGIAFFGLVQRLPGGLD